jgi:hypothetical protein
MKISVTCAGLLLAIALGAMAPAAAHAQDGVADPDAKCLKCHSKNLKKSLADGEKLSLHVSTEDFAQSAHNVIGCTGCHREVAKADRHPSREPVATHREFSLAQNETCKQCHSADFKAYKESIHANLAAHGNTETPVCSDCHTAHAIQTMAVYEPKSGEPCSNCHQDIYQAYEQSVHGQALAHGNVIRDSRIQAPNCADCHKAHDITAVAASNYLQSTCLGCHDNAASRHSKWLPNAGMHMDSVACAACHSPKAQRQVDLQLYDKATGLAVGSKGDDDAVKDRLSEVQAKGDLDAIQLWKLVRQASHDGTPTELTLKGRMEVTNPADAHLIAPKSEAVRSCETCHEGDAASFRNVTVSISTPEGQKQRFNADGEVLSSVVSVESLGGFYAPGGTRIKLLDVLLVLALIGGVAVPIGHITLGKILRKKHSGSSDTE